jgi:hypothetical protein
MRRVLIIGVLTLGIGTSAIAQQSSDPDTATLSHGEFAVLLLRAMSPAPQQVLEPDQALANLKELGLAHSDWTVDGILTHGELADVALQLGIVYTPYTPADRDRPVSPAFAEAFLRREASLLREYRSRRGGHGFSTSHVLDQGVDRAVSPSDFP